MIECVVCHYSSSPSCDHNAARDERGDSDGGQTPEGGV